MDKGRVYWLTGFSNSGKTTIGTALYYKLKKTHNNVVILDGDLMKEIASGSETASYSIKDRKIRARRYSLMAKLLADQGTWVIVCAIAMFDEVREWNRKNILGYIEVFIDAPEEELRKRDKRKLYEIDPNAELPKAPDLTVVNDGINSINDIVNEIEKLKPRYEDDFDRDSEYWNNYYRNKNSDISMPSDFATYVESLLKPQSHILELGCGNGRDSLYFFEKGHYIIGVDGSSVAIDDLNERTKGFDKARFVCDDFVKCHTLYQMQYDCVYSRFTLHAITEEQENEMLQNAQKALVENGILCIEARTIHDDIYGMGKEIAKNTYIYNDHFRRFLEVDKFKEKLVKMGFEIVLMVEDRGFSKTDKSDPILMRCVAKVTAR